MTFDLTNRKVEGEPGPFWHMSNITSLYVRVDTVFYFACVEHCLTVSTDWKLHMKTKTKPKLYCRQGSHEEKASWTVLSLTEET